MTYVRVRLALDRMLPEQVLLVTLKGEEPLRNVPRTAIEQGHEILRLEPAEDGVNRLWIRKKSKLVAPARPSHRDSRTDADPPA